MADLGQPISQLVGNELETLRQRIIRRLGRLPRARPFRISMLSGGLTVVR